jgi:hypothetical protein
MDNFVRRSGHTEIPWPRRLGITTTWQIRFQVYPERSYWGTFSSGPLRGGQFLDSAFQQSAIMNFPNLLERKPLVDCIALRHTHCPPAKCQPMGPFAAAFWESAVHWPMEGGGAGDRPLLYRPRACYVAMRNF